MANCHDIGLCLLKQACVYWDHIPPAHVGVLYYVSKVKILQCTILSTSLRFVVPLIIAKFLYADSKYSYVVIKHKCTEFYSSLVYVSTVVQYTDCNNFCRSFLLDKKKLKQLTNH